MPNNWKKYRLEAIAKRVTVGFVGSMTQAYREKGVPMLRSLNIKPFTIDYSNLKRIDPVFHKKIIKSKLKSGDVVIVRTGNPGTSCVIPNDIGEVNCSDLVIVTPDITKINPHFLSYYFNSIAKGYVNSQLVGAVQQHFNVGSAKEMEIYLPIIEEQNTIVEVINSIQGKIENNLAMNKTLEDMAMALYKHWFVDFGPFADGEFVDSELGMIPKGWEVKPIGDIIETLGGGTPRTKINEFWENGDIEWYSPTDLTKSNSLYSLGSAKKITQLGLQKSSAKIFPKNSLLMSSRATIGAITINRNKACTNQGFITMVPNPNLSLYQLHGWTVSNMDLIISKSNGSTFKEISKTNFRNLLITVGTDTKLYISNVKPLYEKIENNILENETLTQLRDTLLPKLISGEVRLKEFQETLTNVL